MVLEENITELGTDIKSDWKFANGDLVLVDNDANLTQAILNRLNCEYDSLDTYYFEYGTDLSSFLGFKREEATLEFIKIEVEATLEQDPRLPDFDIEAEYGDKGEVLLHILINFNEDSDLSISLVINEDGTVSITDESLSYDEEDLEEEEDYGS